MNLFINQIKDESTLRDFSMAASTLPFISTCLPRTKPFNRSPNSAFAPSCQRAFVPKHNNGCSFPADRSSHHLRTAQELRKTSRSKMDMVVRCIPPPEGSNFPFLPQLGNSWLSWLVGLGLAVPLMVQRLLTMTKQVDLVAQTVEKVADTVEKVAEEVDKVAEGLSESLPEGGVKKIVNAVEHMAEEVAKDAQVVEDLMDKVEEIDEKVESFISEKSKQIAKASSNE